jgi:hypothetical protein
MLYQWKTADFPLHKLLLAEYGGKAEIPIVRFHRVNILQEKLFFAVPDDIGIGLTHDVALQKPTAPWMPLFSVEFLSLSMDSRLPVECPVGVMIFMFVFMAVRHPLITLGVLVKELIVFLLPWLPSAWTALAHRNLLVAPRT